MLIAILSDAHDHEEHLRRALRLAAEAGCSHLLFLGDMAQLSTFRTLRENWAHPIDAIAGNNDYPRADFEHAARMWPHTHWHGECAQLTLDGRRIYMTHAPGYSLQHIVFSGAFDLVLFGHTHQAGQSREADTIVANPGDIQGRYGKPSFAVYNSTEHSLCHISL